jgi:hypothetical protein
MSQYKGLMQFVLVAAIGVGNGKFVRYDLLDKDLPWIRYLDLWPSFQRAAAAERRAGEVNSER